MLVYQIDLFSLISLLKGTHYPNMGMLLKVPLWLWLEETWSILTEYDAINESLETWRCESQFLKDSFTLNSGSAWAVDTNAGEIQLIEENTEKMGVRGGVD